jgi:PTH1 family peptidyl-tRNA hydrolase
MFLIVGLGNPGKKYNSTRHNIGFDVVSELSSSYGLSIGKKLFGALVGDGVIAGQRCVLALPQKFMNRSGQPVASAQGYYKISSDKVIVVHDDLDIDFGSVRCKQKGGHGGHNGLRDIIQHIGNDFLRVRVGVGRPPEGWETANYVLGKWNAQEKQSLSTVIDDAQRAIEMVLQEGIHTAMNTFNIRHSN